jgi:circadian clock protein KaiC
VLLRYIEIGAEIRRAVAVLKIRGSDHDKALRELIFASGQVDVGGRFEGLSGIMTGIPHVVNLSTLGQQATREER